jgi:hypothetical protein
MPRHIFLDRRLLRMLKDKNPLNKGVACFSVAAHTAHGIPPGLAVRCDHKL